MNLKAIYLINSPKVRNIKLIGRGSGTFRSNIKDGWENVKRIEALRPRMRNNVLKNRSGFKKK